MHRLLISHPYGMFASYMWRRYRENGRSVGGNGNGGITFTPDNNSPINIGEDPRTENVRESVTRSISYPGGTGMQIINLEPAGEPCISLHQNHYLLAQGTSLGCVNFLAHDKVGVSLRATADGSWSSVGRPSSFSIHVTGKNEAGPRQEHCAFHIDSSGTISLSPSPSQHVSSLVSLGIYRQGVLQLPTVSDIEELGTIPPSNGMMVYVKNGSMTLLSEGGKWKKIVTGTVN